MTCKTLVQGARRGESQTWKPSIVTCGWQPLDEQSQLRTHGSGNRGAVCCRTCFDHSSNVQECVRRQRRRQVVQCGGNTSVKLLAGELRVQIEIRPVVSLR